MSSSGQDEHPGVGPENEIRLMKQKLYNTFTQFQHALTIFHHALTISLCTNVILTCKITSG